MTKNDLKTGMIVATRNRCRYLVLRGTGMPKSEFGGNDILLGISMDGTIANLGWLPLDRYTDDLVLKRRSDGPKDHDFDIMRIWKTDYANDIGSPNEYRLIWER